MRATHQYHQPDDEGQEKIATLREKFADLDDLIDSFYGDIMPSSASRSKALAKTHLEDARMRAIAGIAMIHDRSEIS